MKQQENKSFSDKHGPEAKVDPTISQAVSERQKEGNLSCSAAFSISKELRVSPLSVGKTVDLMNLRLVKCQLGLFGYKPEKKIVKPSADALSKLENAIRQELVQGRLPCQCAWEIASRLSVPKMTVSSACEAAGIKIKPCQLGAF